MYNTDDIKEGCSIIEKQAELSKIKNIKLVCKNFKLDEPDQKHKPINSWFLRLINLDKKVLTFNLKKKFKLIKPQSKKVFIYNYSFNNKRN